MHEGEEPFPCWVPETAPAVQHSRQLMVHQSNEKGCIRCNCSSQSERMYIYIYIYGAS